MQHFTPVASLVGGIFIGLAATLLLVVNGRIAGITGILGGLVAPESRDVASRLVFAIALILTGVAYNAFQPSAIGGPITSSLPLIAGAGVLVGFGSALGNGCTSGHGVCGISRFSVRSIVATCVFMSTGILTVVLVRHLGGHS